MYKRIQNNDKFFYIDLDTNKKIINKDLLEWFKSLKIPPSYENVVITNNPKDKILAYGYDIKSRKQYIYNKDFIIKQSKKKFKKISKLRFIEIQKNILKDLRDRNAFKKEIAIILYLMLECGFRIGNKKYELYNKSFGISTIKKRHLKFEDNGVIIDFIGKKGVRNIGICRNRIIFDYLYNSCKAKSNEDNVFTNVSSVDVNNYLKRWDNTTTKDIRTWYANQLFKNYLKNKTNINNKKLYSDALKYVSLKLHNTPFVCKKNYIDPSITEKFKK